LCHFLQTHGRAVRASTKHNPLNIGNKRLILAILRMSNVCFYNQQSTYVTYKNTSNLEKCLKYGPPVRMSFSGTTNYFNTIKFFIKKFLTFCIQLDTMVINKEERGEDVGSVKTGRNRFVRGV